MSETHPPEATQTWVWVCLKSPATCFWGKMQKKSHLPVMGAPIHNSRGRV